MGFVSFCGQSIYAEEASLNDLHDIVMPEPVSAWPPAPGWWFIFLLIVLTAAALFLRWFRQYRNNVYRRAALAELEAAESAAAAAEILRRTALAAYPREDIVPLQGEAWFQWLETTGSLPMPEPAKNAITNIYTESSTGSEELKQFTKKWIIKHSAGTE